jgi:uncharacterized protein YwgA
MELIERASALVRLNGGEIVGKTRFQKIAYLLETVHLGLGLEFDYHNYGPFSAELATSLDDAEAMKLVEAVEVPGFHEVPYTLFRMTPSTPSFEDSKETRKRREALEKMSGYSALILELAATAVYLDQNGYPGKAWEEVAKRKPLKATSERVEKAKGLLRQLELSPA